MKCRLCKDDAAAPTVQEVEVLVGNTGQHGENAFTTGEQDGERGERIGKDADTVRPPSQSRSSLATRLCWLNVKPDVSGEPL